VREGDAGGLSFTWPARRVSSFVFAKAVLYGLRTLTIYGGTRTREHGGGERRALVLFYAYFT
jgi:hypothetical protein